MEIRIRATGQVVTESDFRAMHPDTKGPIAAMMGQFDADPVLEAPAPAVNDFQTAQRNGAVQDALGNWVYAWTVRNWTQPEIDAYAKSGKLAAWNRIKAHRDFLELNGVFVAGKWFHSDEKSQIKHLGLKDRARDLLAAGGALSDPIKVLGQPVYWQSIDNTPVLVTAQLAFDLVNAVGELQARVFVIAKQHRAQMEGAVNPGAYNHLATGPAWPATYIPPKT